MGLNNQPFELKIQLKVGLLRPKIMLKHLLNYSKTNFEKISKMTFFNPKRTKQGCQLWERRSIFLINFGQVKNLGNIFKFKGDLFNFGANNIPKTQCKGKIFCQTTS